MSDESKSEPVAPDVVPDVVPEPAEPVAPELVEPEDRKSPPNSLDDVAVEMENPDFDAKPSGKSHKKK